MTALLVGSFLLTYYYLRGVGSNVISRTFSHPVVLAASGGSERGPAGRGPGDLLILSHLVFLGGIPSPMTPFGRQCSS